MDGDVPTEVSKTDNLRPEDKMKKAEAIIDGVKITEEKIQRMMEVMEAEMKLGLSKDKAQRKQSSLQMENTFVRDLLDGTEEGDYLALDLGGTNFRVLLLQMRAGKCVLSKSRNYNVPEERLTGDAVGVMDHLAESISKFVDEEKLQGKRLPLGFTFSFPMVQYGINSGILVTWTKSFRCTTGVGEDAVLLLEQAIARRGDLDVEIVAIMNDTTGTMMAGAYLDHQCEIGLILGTGSNACYMEHLENVGYWDGDLDPPQTIIDIEWGAFGDNGVLEFIKNDYDREVDKHSNHVGSFTFEKLFSGMYLGEQVRLVLLRMLNEGVIFQGEGSEKLKTRWAFLTKYVSWIEKDTDEDVSNTRHVLEEMGLSQVSCDHDVTLLRQLCSVLSQRIAQLVVAGLVVILRRINKKEATIAIDGSLYRYHPKLHDLMMAELEARYPSTKCKIILAEDGSGRGAGFVAAVAVRFREQHGKPRDVVTNSH